MKSWGGKAKILNKRGWGEKTREMSKSPRFQKQKAWATRPPAEDVMRYTQDSYSTNL